MESEEGVMRPAVDAEGTKTEQPEHDLRPRDPAMEGAAPPDEKKGMARKVKDMMGRKKTKKRDKETAVSKDGICYKIKVKASSKVGHGEDGAGGPAHLLSMSSGSISMSSSDEEDIGTVGFAMDPTGPAVAGSTLGRHDYVNAPTGPGANFDSLTLDEDDDAAVRRHSERAAQYSVTSNPRFGEPVTTPSAEDDASHRTPSDDAHGDRSPPHPSASEPNSEGGEHHGNDGVKEEGFMQRILNKVY